jgi:hypothetical protein
LRQHIDINDSIPAPCLFITVADVSKASCEVHERTVTVEKHGKEDIGLVFFTDSGTTDGVSLVLLLYLHQYPPHSGSLCLGGSLKQ